MADDVTARDLPTSRQLVRSTAIAAAVAAALVVVAVLPAEYGVDPTGIGRLLGLTPMGEIKMSLAKEAAEGHRAAALPPVCAPASVAPASSVGPAGSASSSAPAREAGPARHEVRITLRPNEGKEVKLAMRKGARASYIWSADGGLTFDTHGEVADGAADTYVSYGKGTQRRLAEGEIVAAFDGVHGWFWRNRNHQDVTLTLRTHGDYQELKESGSIAPTKPLDPPPAGHGHAH